MKKYLIILFACVPLLVSANFDKDLYYGMKGDSQIQELQEFLTNKGFYSGPITGNFFSLTLKAVKSFQTAQSIISTGYFGRLTRGKVNTLLESAGVTSTGITNESGIILNPSITTPKSGDNGVTKLNEQIKVLMDQLAELKKNQNTLTQQNQTLQTIQQQQASTTAQIAQHIALLASPVPTPSPTPVPTPSPIIIYVTPQPVPDINEFTVEGGVGEDYRVRSDGTLDYKAVIQLKYRTGKSNISLSRPKGISVSASVPSLNFNQTSITDGGNYGGDSRVYAKFSIPVKENGIYPIIFSSNGATFNYDLVVSNIDFRKSVLCKETGAFCESKDIAFLDMTPRVVKISEAKELSANTGEKIIGEARIVGIADAQIHFIGFESNFPYRINISPSIGNDYLRIITGYDGKIVIRFNTGSVALGTYTATINKIIAVGISDGHDKSFSNLPVTFTFEVK